VNPQPVARLDLTSPPDLITVGQTVRMTAVAKSATGAVLPGRAITWTSSQTAVAVITADGDLTAAGEGTTVVTAVSEGKAAQHTVRVTVQELPMARLVIVDGDAPVDLRIGALRSMQAEARDANGQVLGGKFVTWHSNDTDVAQVTGDGRITAVFTGTAKVIAQSGAFEDTVVVRVTPNVQRVDLEPANAVLVMGDVVRLYALPRGEGDVVLNASVSWRSSDASVVEVDHRGLLTPRKPGIVRITATAEGVEGHASVVVVGAANFTATQVNGSALPTTMFRHLEPDGTTTRYDAHAGSLRLTGAGRYEQTFEFLVFPEGHVMYGGTFKYAGDVTRDPQTGTFHFRPDNEFLQPFTGEKTSETTLLVTQRYFANASEATVLYEVQ
jgi:uncharacterized protein YjdB